MDTTPVANTLAEVIRSMAGTVRDSGGSANVRCDLETATQFAESLRYLAALVERGVVVPQQVEFSMVVKSGEFLTEVMAIQFVSREIAEVR